VQAVYELVYTLLSVGGWRPPGGVEHRLHSEHPGSPQAHWLVHQHMLATCMYIATFPVVYHLSILIASSQPLHIPLSFLHAISNLNWSVAQDYIGHMYSVCSLIPRQAGNETAHTLEDLATSTASGLIYCLSAFSAGYTYLTSTTAMLLAAQEHFLPAN